jgi:hypothetical protein
MLAYTNPCKRMPAITIERIFLTNFNVPPSLLLRNTEIMTVFIRKLTKKLFSP